MGFASTNEKVDQAGQDSGDKGYMIGTVVENEDPEGLNRIKVKIPNFWDPGQGELPWVGPHPYSPFGIGQDFGTYGAPAIGAQVKVLLQDGDSNYGFYEASLYSKANANAKFKSPKTWGFKDPSGNELFVDMEHEDWQFTHSSGTTIFHDKDGNLTVHVVKDQLTTVDGKVDTKVTDTVKLDAGGNITIITAGNCDLTASGNVDVTASGDVKITGATVQIN